MNPGTFEIDLGNFGKILEIFGETANIFLFLDIALQNLEISLNWNVQFWKIICLGKL